MSDFTLVTKLDCLEASAYFKDTKNYVNFGLPPYFSFDQILLSSSAILNGKSLKDICVERSNGKPDYPCNYSDVNYILLSNKDGGFAWRPLQVIHPILYVDLVNLITERGAWSELVEFFKRRAKSSVSCISLPLRSNTSESSRAVLVSNWWDKIEQESLRMALDFRFMFQTDISNCYSSIYTHSLEWALCVGGRKEIKERRANGDTTSGLGLEIDIKLRNMCQGQTIGIPQGSVLMDFIAEIVLGGADIELTERIMSTIAPGSLFKILRYRDDYRVFSNDYQVGHEIMKQLNSVLYSWNMKMNTSKTSETSDIITSSVKHEKLEEIYTAPSGHSFQKAAMRIYILSKRYPNSGLVAKSLTEYYDKLKIIERKKKDRKIDFEVIVSIITMIAYYSPRYMPQVASIITTLIDMSGKKLDRKKVISRIVNKFNDLPNTEFIDIWLQRITDLDDISSYEFESTISKVALAHKDNSALWNSDWLIENDKKTIESIGISDLPEKIEERSFSPIIEREEFELYGNDYD